MQLTYAFVGDKHTHTHTQTHVQLTYAFIGEEDLHDVPNNEILARRIARRCPCIANPQDIHKMLAFVYRTDEQANHDAKKLNRTHIKMLKNSTEPTLTC